MEGMKKGPFSYRYLARVIFMKKSLTNIEGEAGENSRSLKGKECWIYREFLENSPIIHLFFPLKAWILKDLSNFFICFGAPIWPPGHSPKTKRNWERCKKSCRWKTCVFQHELFLQALDAGLNHPLGPIALEAPKAGKGIRVVPPRATKETRDPQRRWNFPHCFWGKHSTEREGRSL